jgi:hypothetical protein
MCVEVNFDFLVHQDLVCKVEQLDLVLVQIP